MATRRDLCVSITGKRLFGRVQTVCEDLLVASQPIGIHHQLLEAGAQAAFQPAGGMQHKIRPGQHRRMHRVGAFIGGLRILDLRCRQ